MDEKIVKISKMIERQRTKPRFWDFSFLLLRNNLGVFKRFSELLSKNPGSRILDVGSGFNPWAGLLPKSVEYLGIDFDKSLSSADYVGTADHLPFADSNFDALIYSEVLEHVDDLPWALSEMKRVIKPGGLVYISTPFMFPEHGIPHDYQRLTRYFYQKTFGPQIIILQESNGSFATALIALNLFIESSPFNIFWGIKHIIYFLTNIFAIFSDWVVNFIFNRIGKSYRQYFFRMPLGYALIVRIEK